MYHFQESDALFSMFILHMRDNDNEKDWMWMKREINNMLRSYVIRSQIIQYHHLSSKLVLALIDRLSFPHYHLISQAFGFVPDHLLFVVFMYFMPAMQLCRTSSKLLKVCSKHCQISMGKIFLLCIFNNKLICFVVY